MYSFFDDFVHFFSHINYSTTVRVIVISAQGKHFCAGLDLKEAGQLIAFPDEKDPARTSLDFERKLEHLQQSFQLIERCRFPVIAAVDGSCIGGAIDLITACDIVYCTQSAKFAIKEIDLAIIADLGTLNRLPLITANWGLMKELALTGSDFGAATAIQIGLVARQFSTLEEMNTQVSKLAQAISSKSPVAALGTKKVLNHLRSKQVEEGMQFVKNYNMSQIFTHDIPTSMAAFFQKQKPVYPKL